MFTIAKLFVLSISIPLALFAVFVISPQVDAQAATPAITVLSPNGGEIWKIGETYPIQWSTIGYGSDAIVQIRLTDARYPHDARGEVSIVIETPNTGSYSWTVPLTTVTTSEGAGSTHKIQIHIRPADEGWGGARGTTDGSNSYFSIVPFLNVLSPNGGEQWVAGSTQTVKWLGISTGNISLIELQGELGGGWHLVYNTPNDSSEVITVPNVPPGRYKISLNTDIIAGKIVEDQSDNYFSIVSSTTTQPFIRVLFPNGGNQLQKGTAPAITWNSNHASGVYIKLRKGTDTYPGIEGKVTDIISNTGSYQWIIPTTLPDGSDYSIRVVDSAGSIFDDSDAFFNIISSTDPADLPDFVIESFTLPTSTVVNQEAVATFTVMNRGTGTFFWEKYGYGVPWKVAGGETTQRVISDGCYTSVNIVPGAGCQVSVGLTYTTSGTPMWVLVNIDPYNKIAETNKSNSSANKSFTVSAATQPSITVLSPNGGEMLAVGQNYTIRWKAAGLDQVRILLLSQYPNNPSTFKVTAVASDVGAAEGTYFWQIPSVLPISSLGDSSNPIDYPCHKIEVVDARYGRGSTVEKKFSDESDACFSIVSTTQFYPGFFMSTNKTSYPLNGEPILLTLTRADGKSEPYEVDIFAIPPGKDQASKALLKRKAVVSDSIKPTLIIPVSRGEVPVFANGGGQYLLLVCHIDGCNLQGPASTSNSIPLNIESQKLSVDLKINGSDTPTAVSYNAVFTASWTSIGAVNCAAFLHFIPAVEGGLWTDFKNLPSSGNKNLYARHQNFDYLPNLLVGIQCFDNSGRSVVDEVSLPVEAPLAIITLHAPEMAYPKDRQILDLEGSYMFKIEPMKGASAYSLKLHQGGELLYNSELEHEGGLNTTGEFAIHPDNLIHAKFKVGDVEVIARVKIGEKWSDARAIIITLKPRKIEFSQKKEHCLPEGTLLKSPDDPKVYIIRDCKKEWVKTTEEFQRSGYEWDDVRSAADPIIGAYADYLLATANLLRAVNQDKVYRIVEGKKLWIPSIEAFNTQKLDWSEVKETAPSELASYPIAKLLRARNDSKVYFITDSGLKKWIRTAEIFGSYSSNRWSDIVEVEPEVINSFNDAQLIKLEGDYKVYKLENNEKRWVKTVEAFLKNKFNWDNILTVNKAELNYYTEGKPVE